MQVTNPVQGEIVDQNDTLMVSVIFSDPSGVATINISLIDNLGNTLWHPSISFVPGSTNISFNDFVVNNLIDTTLCTLNFESTDSKGNYSHTILHVTLNGGGLGPVITSQDFALALQLSTEVIHIADQSIYSGSYGPCAGVQINNANSADADTLIVNFGASNCLDADGRYRRGIVRAIWSGGDYSDSLVQKQFDFVSYYVNDIQLTGTIAVSNNGHVNGNTNYNVNTVVATISTVTSGVFNGTLNFEQVAGSYTAMFTDDTWKVTGYANGTDRYNRNYTAQTVSPLIRSFGCWKYIVQGSVDITPNNMSLQYLDYGNGACENNAMVTILPNVYTITLP